MFAVCKKLLMQRIAFIQFRVKCKCRLIFAADGYDVAIDGCENLHIIRSL